MSTAACYLPVTGRGCSFLSKANELLHMMLGKQLRDSAVQSYLGIEGIKRSNKTPSWILAGNTDLQCGIYGGGWSYHHQPSQLF